MATLLTVGETMGVAATSPGTPLRTASQLRLSTAGAEATVAIGMRRLGHDAIWVGAVGNDAVGDRIICDLRAEGVDTRFVHRIPGAASGFMLRNHQTPDFVDVGYYRTGMAGGQVTADDVNEAFEAEQVDLVHLTGITPVLSETELPFTAPWSWLPATGPWFRSTSTTAARWRASSWQRPTQGLRGACRRPLRRRRRDAPPMRRTRPNRRGASTDETGTS